MAANASLFSGFLPQVAFQGMLEWSIVLSARGADAMTVVTEGSYSANLLGRGAEDISRALLGGAREAGRPDDPLAREFLPAAADPDPHRLLVWTSQMKRAVLAQTPSRGPASHTLAPLSLTLLEAHLLWQGHTPRGATRSFVDAAKLSASFFHNGPYLRALAARVHLLAGAYLLLLPDIRTVELSQCFRLFENSEDFYRHALEAPPKELFSRAAEAHDRMGILLLDDGQRDEATGHFLKASQLRERVSPRFFPKAIARYRRPKKE
jgi:hypothetical protein